MTKEAVMEIIFNAEVLPWKNHPVVKDVSLKNNNHHGTIWKKTVHP